MHRRAEWLTLQLADIRGHTAQAMHAAPEQIAFRAMQTMQLAGARFADRLYRNSQTPGARLRMEFQ